MGNVVAAVQELQRVADTSSNSRAPETLYGSYFLATHFEKQPNKEGGVCQ